MKESDITICGHGSGTPSTKRLDEYCTKRYNQIAPNGKHKGIIAVRRLKKLTDPKRKEFSSTYKTILGRNIYSQPRRAYVYTRYSDGKYYSDCSSSGMATFKKIGYKLKWLYNTAAIYEEDDFVNVPVKIKNGHIQNPEVLKVGDCLLFVGSDPTRPKQIGHVEYVYRVNSSGGNNNKKYEIAEPVLRKGSESKEEVKTLQRNLNVAKCRDDEGKKLGIDGDFGNKTEQALINFQKSNNLEDDGIYGNKSASKMDKVLNG